MRHDDDRDDDDLSHANAVETLEDVMHAIPAADTADARADLAAQLIELGRDLEWQDDHDRAMGCFSQAASLFRDIGEVGSEADALGMLGITADAAGQPERAVTSFEQALVLHRAASDRAGEAADLGNLANALVSLGHVAEAIQRYEEARSLHVAVGDRDAEASDIANLGGLYHEQGDLDRALDHHQRAAALMREVGDHAREAVTLRSLGETLAARQDWEDALAALERALTLHTRLDARDELVVDLRAIAFVHMQREAWAEAVNLLEQALALANEEGDHVAEADVLGELGPAYAESGQVERGLACLEAAAALAETIGDAEGQAIHDMNRAVVLRDQNDHEGARAALTAALERLEAMDSPFTEQALALAATLPPVG